MKLFAVIVGAFVAFGLYRFYGLGLYQSSSFWDVLIFNENAPAA